MQFFMINVIDYFGFICMLIYVCVYTSINRLMLLVRLIIKVTILCFQTNYQYRQMHQPYPRAKMFNRMVVSFLKVFSESLQQG